VTIVDVLTSTEFLQGLFLLVVTAVLTGLLVPVIKGRLDDRKYRDQKVFESELSRQEKVLDAQAALLKDTSEVMWSFYLLSLKVTWYAANGNEERFDAAWKEWDEESWLLFGRLRAEISKARRLTSPAVHEELLNVHEFWFRKFSLELEGMVRRRDIGTGESVDFHNRTYRENTNLIDDALTRLAEELRLSEAAVGSRPSSLSSRSAGKATSSAGAGAAR
jgi:hypothetical protein